MSHQTWLLVPMVQDAAGSSTSTTAVLWQPVTVPTLADLVDAGLDGEQHARPLADARMTSKRHAAQRIQADRGLWFSINHDAPLGLLGLSDDARWGEPVPAAEIEIFRSLRWTAPYHGDDWASLHHFPRRMTGLLPLLATHEEELRSAFQRLAHHAPELAHRYLDGIQERPPFRWLPAQTLLEQFPDGLPRPVLTDLLEHGDRDVREAAIQALQEATQPQRRRGR